MTDPRTTESAGRAVSAAEADHSLSVLTRHALTVRTGAAPTSITVANGPVVLRISWDGAAASDAGAGVSGEISALAHAGSTADLATVASHGAHAAVRASNGHPANGVGRSVAENDGSDAGNGTGAATFTLTAETVGVFYRSSEPGAAPFVAEGDPVRAGQQVGIVEAMKLMIPVLAAKEGVVAEFLVADSESVEHGQPLIVFEVLR